MNYRGDDLDLRTPRGSASPGDPEFEGATRPIERYAAPRRPIWVDETVLACCNQAFELAQGHRASEVRLEHLLHAMTRVESAAEVLEARGVRVFNLRRETASLMGADAPAGPKDGTANPRRSDELEDVLRRAAAQAYRHGVSVAGDPASVDDIVDVLSDPRLNLPGVAVFARHLGRGFRELPSMRRMVPYGYDAGSQSGGHRERGRFSPATYGQEGGAPTSRRDGYVEHYDVSRAPEPSFPAQMLDRLEALEQALHDLTSGAAADSRVVQNVVGQIERSMEAGAEDFSSRWERVMEALKGLDARLAKTAEGAALTPIDGRLALIEEAILGSPAETGQEAGARFDTLRHTLEEQRARALAAYSSIDAEIKALRGALPRVDNLPATLERHHGELASSVSGALTKLTSAATDRVQALVADAGAKHEQRLAAIENAVVGTLRAIEQRQKNVSTMIEQWGRANGECLDHIDGRLERLEASHARAMDMIETVYRLTVDRLHWRQRFWRWLLGTNDWMAASWPAQSARVDAEMRGRVEA